MECELLKRIDNYFSFFLARERESDAHLSLGMKRVRVCLLRIVLADCSRRSIPLSFPFLSLSSSSFSAQIWHCRFKLQLRLIRCLICRKKWVNFYFFVCRCVLVLRCWCNSSPQHRGTHATIHHFFFSLCVFFGCINWWIKKLGSEINWVFIIVGHWRDQP